MANMDRAVQIDTNAKPSRREERRGKPRPVRLSLVEKVVIDRSRDDLLTDFGKTTLEAVSYTHLDVYKRQSLPSTKTFSSRKPTSPQATGYCATPVSSASLPLPSTSWKRR